MKKNFLFFIFTLFIFSNVIAQKSEYGITLGGSLFSGDVNTNFAFKETKPSIGAIYRHHLSNKFTIRPSFLFSTLSGSDYENEGYSDKDIWRKFRNLSFRSRILELSICGEYYLKDLLQKKSTPYAFAGLGIFYFNPQAKYQGEWHNLKPLSTEGQGIPGYNVKEYKRLQPNAIVGLGWKFKIKKRLSFGLEAGLRFTRTDYIDDVSGDYIDKTTLNAERGSIAVALSDRSKEIDWSAIGMHSPYSGNYGQEGFKRGNPGNYDKYLICNFTITYVSFKSIGSPALFLLD